MGTLLVHVPAVNGQATPSAETVAVTFPVLATGPVSKVIIRGTICLTAGTGTTAITVRIRQGTTVAGAQVGNTVQQTIAAGNTGVFTIDVEDTTGWLQAAGGNQYVLTVLQTGGTANGSIISGGFSVETP